MVVGVNVGDEEGLDDGSVDGIDDGADDGSDDGSDYNEFGIEEEEIFYFEPEAEEVFFTEEVEYTSLEDLDEDIEQIVMEEIFEDDDPAIDMRELARLKDTQSKKKTPPNV